MGAIHSHRHMYLNDPFRPRPFGISLAFTPSHGGHISDLRRGIRMFLMRYYHSEAALMMSISATYNYVFSRDRKERCIVLTIDAPHSEGLLLDIYARLYQQGGRIRAPLTCYEVSIQGNVDIQRLHALTAHYFRMSALFQRHIGCEGGRFLLN